MSKLHVENIIRVQGSSRKEGINEFCQVRNKALKRNPIEGWASPIRPPEAPVREPERKQVLFYSSAMRGLKQVKEWRQQGARISTQREGVKTHYVTPGIQDSGRMNPETGIEECPQTYPSRELQDCCFSHSGV